MTTERAEPYRVITRGFLSSTKGNPYGFFLVPFESNELTVVCAPTDAEWQHVSVSLPNRCPNWKELCFIKDLFWEEEEIVFQLHPKKTEYVNVHPNCLHLWRNQWQDPPLPPSFMV